MKNTSFLLKPVTWLIGRRLLSEIDFILSKLFGHCQDSGHAAKNAQNGTTPQVDPVRAQALNAGAWRAVHNSNAFATFLEDPDPTRDVRLYIYGDFANEDERKEYAVVLADMINNAIFANRRHLGADNNHPANR